MVGEYCEEHSRSELGRRHYGGGAARVQNTGAAYVIMKEVTNDKREDLFAATPPLKAN